MGYMLQFGDIADKRIPYYYDYYYYYTDKENSSHSKHAQMKTFAHLSALQACLHLCLVSALGPVSKYRLYLNSLDPFRALQSCPCFILYSPVPVSCTTILSLFHTLQSCPCFILYNPVPVSYSTVLSLFRALQSCPCFVHYNPVPVSCTTILSLFHTLQPCPCFVRFINPRHAVHAANVDPHR